MLRRVTGWALLAAAGGVLWDAWASWDSGAGSFGLVPFYLGFPIGGVGLAIVMQRTVGVVAAVQTAVGVAGMLYFMGAYPDGATGWLGAVLIGVAHLYLPLPTRFVSPLWVASGILGFPPFGSPDWGVVSAFTVFGAAVAASGTAVLWGALPIRFPATLAGDNA